ncbi:putative uncharacterized protein DDB_G0282129 [Tigriopus californicus]|uniref:putative uncharacterized protein DDB_G0282129 n=1 Tax=Tigriopus californicus TaxID=6832 RepID=UPI0027DA2C24|nr:putative uncharacterized protein DDB_G0282129 [Tigriopus californicus]XP_059088541.1 putative uncharacterized protein DDB_G0282129 [Tigriopus californicus]
MRIQISLICLWVCIALSQGLYVPHSTSTSQYIHSNDTIVLSLDPSKHNSLHGPVGSMQTLNFVLINRDSDGHFTFSQSSDDGFEGRFENGDSAYLSSGQQQSIVVSNLRVPNRPEGAKVRLSITVTRDSGLSKREAPPPNGAQVGGGSSVGGGQSNYPNGNNNNNNNNNDYNNNNNNNYPGGNYPGGNYPGGNYPGGNYPGSNYPGGNYPGNNYNPNDPSRRRQLVITVEFTVTEDLRDTSKPWTQLTYGAQTEEDTCSYTPEDANCYMDYWWVKFQVQDEESGLNTVQLSPIGTDKYNTPIYYRYENFNLGTDKEHDIVAAASCCLEGMILRLTDISGNQVEHEAYNSGVGKEMSPGLFWGLIVGGIVVVIVIIVGVVMCCKKSGYNRASTG